MIHEKYILGFLTGCSSILVILEGIEIITKMFFATVVTNLVIIHHNVIYQK